MAAYFLIDVPGDTYYPRPEGTRLINSPAASHKAVTWIVGAWRAVGATRSDDLLLCYLDIQAVLCWWFARLTLRRRNIVAINLLLKDKPTLRNRLTTLLYRRALSSPRFYATVTSEEYGQWLNRKLGHSFSYYYLPDLYAYDGLHEQYKGVAVEPRTVFCGGRNGRDWATMLAIAEAMPSVAFKLVMPSAVQKSLPTPLPPNVAVSCDISTDDFLRTMAACQAVCMPLDTEAPAGLIVLFQAAALGKPIVISDTVTTRAYICPDMSDAHLVAGPPPIPWAKALAATLSQPPSATNSLRDYLRGHCSPSHYVHWLKAIIADLGAATT